MLNISRSSDAHQQCAYGVVHVRIRSTAMADMKPTLLLSFNDKQTTPA